MQISMTTGIGRCVLCCVLHIKPFFLPVDIQHSHSFRADSSILVEEIPQQALRSQPYDTAAEIPHFIKYKQSRVDDAIHTCDRTGYDKHETHILKKRGKIGRETKKG